VCRRVIRWLHRSSWQNPSRCQCYIFSTTNKLQLSNKSHQCKQSNATRTNLSTLTVAFPRFPISSKVQQLIQRLLTPPNAKRIIEQVCRPSNKHTHRVENSMPSLFSSIRYNATLSTGGDQDVSAEAISLCVTHPARTRLELLTM
jgi:hypothetical protein